MLRGAWRLQLTGLQRVGGNEHTHRQRYRPREKGCGPPLMMHAVVKWLKSIIEDRSSRSLFTFGRLSHFFSHLTAPRTLSKMGAQLFVKGQIPSCRTVGACLLIMGVGAPPWWASRSLPVHVQTGKFSLTSKWSSYLFTSARAQLLPWLFLGQKFNFYSIWQIAAIQP